MLLQIGPNDQVGFERARDWLLSGFGRWLRDELRLPHEFAAAAVGDVAIALDWKFGYDGHLGHWTAAGVAEFLLRWCPRKLSVSQADCVTIPGSVAAFTDYLAAQGLLARGSAPAAVLRATATRAAAEFVAEMGNLPLRPSLPPVALPPQDVIAASEESAPVLEMFAKLAGFAGAGRPLTQAGNLRLADARELVALLGTGDLMDESIGDRVFLTRSSTELPTLRLIFAWAKKAGVVRVQRGKMLATKRGLALADNPAGMFDKALDALLAAGPLAARHRPGAWQPWPEVDQAADSMVVSLLIGPYAERTPVPLAEITVIATQAMFRVFEFGEVLRQDIAAHMGWVMAMIMDALELAGVVRRTGVPESERDYGLTLQGGNVELTPAGLAAVQRRLAAAGYRAPVAGRFAEASAVDLLTGTDAADVPLFLAEVDAWRQRRTPEQAVAELADAVRQVTEPALQDVALAIMAEIGPELAAPHVRGLTDDGVARGLALCWLAEHGLAAERELYDPSDPDGFADVLAHRLATGRSDAMLACLALAGDDAAQARLVTELGLSSSPSADVVLEAIGRTHQISAVVKAARKALFLRRSRVASSAYLNGQHWNGHHLNGYSLN